MLTLKQSPIAIILMLLACSLAEAETGQTYHRTTDRVSNDYLCASL